MKIKADLDREVALRSSLGINKVQQLTTLFMEEVATALVEDGSVRLPGLGTITVYVHTAAPSLGYPLRRGNTRHIGIRISKSRALKKRLKEKYDGEVRSG